MQLKKRGKDRLAMWKNGKDTSLASRISETIADDNRKVDVSQVTLTFKPGAVILKGELIVSTNVGYCRV